MGGTTPDGFAAMQTQIAVLENRLDELKNEVEGKEKSVFNRTSKWTGLVALFLAIVGGGFTVYEKLVAEPRKNKATNITKLQEIVGDLTKVNAELARQSRTLPPDEYMLAASIQNGVKFTLTKRAAIIIDRLEFDVDAATLLTIASEFQQSEELEKSARFARVAFDVAETDQMRAEARRYLADAIMLQGGDSNIRRARDLYKGGIAIAAKMKGNQSFAVIGNIYRDWITAESLGGRCDLAKKLVGLMHAELTEDNARFVLDASKAQVTVLLQRIQICPDVVTLLTQE